MSEFIQIVHPFFSETEEQKEDRIKRTDELARYYMEQRIEKENRDKIKKEHERQVMKDLIKEALMEVLIEFEGHIDENK
jgi:hypothetical protein